MHGRQKKERTAEEEDAKNKEHAKKVAAYRHAMGLIFSKRSKNELDEEILKISGQVLAVNPDIGTLWNIRKETLLIMKKADYTNFSDVIVPKELDFTEFCLKSNPKSYGAWHHRYWLMKETNFSKVASELKLCAKYLEYDDRNFHGWDYRRILVENFLDMTLEKELEFTTEKISSNFSNFSSWHLRSKILPKLSKDYLEEELELIRNAVFTDPKDQSAWFYHRWLLRSQLKQETPFLIGAQHKGSKIILIFNMTVPIPAQLDIKVKSEGGDAEGSWSNPWANTCSKMWEYELLSNIAAITVTGDSNLLKNFGSDSLVLNSGDVRRNFPEYFDSETKLKAERFLNLLKDEISWVQELQELEPDVKWPISTLIMLMRMVDFKGYKADILKHLDSLIKLDSKRINYYLDLRSKYLVEWKFIENGNHLASDCLDEKPFDLSGLNLTALYYPERMSFHTDINLSGNALKNCEPFRALLNCKSIDITGNKLEDKDIKHAIKEVEKLQL